MSNGKVLLWLGGAALAASTAAFETATFSSLRYFSIGSEIPPVALLVGAVGLFAAVAGGIMVSRETEGQKLLVAGLFVLGAAFLSVSILNHISPDLFNVHIGAGGFIAPMVASLLVGLICIVAGIARLL
jgi:hypothetical protein